MQVMKLSPDGKVLMTLGKAGQGGKGLDVFDQPTSVAIAPNGDIFVAEGHAPTFGNSRIMKFDKDGKFIKTFGHVGSGDGEMKSPHVIVFDSQGRLFVADRSNSRIDIFDQDGKFLAAWKQFGRPSGIWIDKNDTLYVTDSESEDAPGKDTNNPGCNRGIRIGSVKTGKVDVLYPAATGVRPEIAAAGRGRRRFPRHDLRGSGAGQIRLQICEELNASASHSPGCRAIASRIGPAKSAYRHVGPVAENPRSQALAAW